MSKPTNRGRHNVHATAFPGTPRPHTRAQPACDAAAVLRNKTARQDEEYDMRQRRGLAIIFSARARR